MRLFWRNPMVILTEDPGRGPCRALRRTTIYRFSTLRDLLDPIIAVFLLSFAKLCSSDWMLPDVQVSKDPNNFETS